jgi:nucleoside-diphosphate-sugar epimerase
MWRVVAEGTVTEQRGIILVTGSSGYLGYAVARRLSETFAVVGFDRRAPSHPPPTADCLYVDLTSEPSLRRGLHAVRDVHGNRLASVIHLAAYYDFSGTPSPLYEKVTVRGTERLLRLLQEMEFSVEQFVFSSTMLVHAPTVPGKPINEDWPLQPKWAYPQSKVRTEQVIQNERGQIPLVILRIAGVYDNIGHSAPLPRQIQRIFERDPAAYVFPGNLDHGQAFVHLSDVVNMYVRLVEQRAVLSSDVILEVGEPETLGYGDLQRLLGRLIHGEDWKTRRISKRVAKVGAWVLETLPFGRKSFIKPWMIGVADDHFELDISRARALVGWEPQHRLRDALPKIVTALKADPWAWYRENELEMPAWLVDLTPEPAEPEIAPSRFEKLSEMARRAPHVHGEAAMR